MEPCELSDANTAIVLDSTSDLPGARAPRRNWHVVPLYVELAGESRRDWVDLPPMELYAQLRAGARSTTSQPSPGDFAAAFQELAGYERIVCVTLSTRLSGTFASAELAARDDDRLLLVDSGTISGGIQLLAHALQRRLERGTHEAELLAVTERFRREAGFVWTVQSLDWLVRGGRIGKARRLAGQLLETKPILGLAGGEVEPLGRVRGRGRSLAELERRFAEATGDDPRLHIAVVHADAATEADGLVARVRELRPRASVDFVGLFGAVLGSHTGPGGVALAWYRDDDI